ncbi:MAG: M56 family metallopeptidase [Planctomycetota bacterium]|nr:M56 family metallopeptidase [Planctomycetota bacterium]
MTFLADLSDLCHAAGQSPAVYRLGWTLVHTLWLGALVGLAFVLVQQALRRRTAHARYLVGCVALAIMLALPVAVFCVVPPLPPAPAPAAVPLTNSDPMPPDGSRGDFLPNPPAPVLHIDSTPPRAPVAPPVSPPPSALRDLRDLGGESLPPSPWSARAAQTLQPALPWIVLAWLAGVAMLSLWQLAGWIAATRLKRLALRPREAGLADVVASLAEAMRVTRPVRVLESALVRVPTVVGWLRPAILVPLGLAAGLAPQQVQAILAHELAHVRRYDYLVNLLQSVVETLLFYHPAVWAISRRIRLEREHCCDDIVVAAGAEPLCYAETLLALGERSAFAASPSRLPSSGVALASPAKPSQLRLRIHRLLGVPDLSSARRTRSALAALIVVLALALTVGLHLSARAGNPPPATQPAQDPGADAATFESFSVELITTDMWMTTISIRGDGNCTFEMKRRGLSEDKTLPERYAEQFRLNERDQTGLVGLLKNTKWLATPGKVQPGLKDGTKYAMSVVRGGRTARTVCYGSDQDPNYSSLVHQITTIYEQEWRLFNLKRGWAEAAPHLAYIDSELRVLLGEAAGQLPVFRMDYRRFLKSVEALAQDARPYRRQLAEEVAGRIRKYAAQRPPEPATQPAEGAPAFGPVQEKRIYADPTQGETFLDLDTGAAMRQGADDTPDEPGMSKEQNREARRRAWAKSSGADLMVDPNPQRYEGKVFGLRGFDLAVVRRPPGDDLARLTPQDALGALEGREAYREAELLASPKELPATSVLQTREGRICALQIIAFDPGQNVTLRYRITSAPVATPARPLWITIAPSEETVPAVKDLAVLADGRNLNQDAAKAGEWEIRTADNGTRIARIAYQWPIGEDQFLSDGKRITGGGNRTGRFTLNATQLRMVPDLADGQYVLAWYVAGQRRSNVMPFRIDRAFEPKKEPLLKLAAIEPAPGQALPSLLLRAYRHAEADPAPRASDVAFATLNVDGQDRMLGGFGWSGRDEPLRVGEHYVYILNLDGYTTSPTGAGKLPPIDPGKPHTIFARLAGRESNRIVLASAAPVGAAWDAAAVKIGPAPQVHVLVKGTVIGPDGMLAARYEVSVVSAADATLRFRTTTDAQGRYEVRSNELRCPAAGAFDVGANPPAMGQPGVVARQVTLYPQKTVDLHLSLQPLFTISGRVTFPDGSPAANRNVKSTWSSPDGQGEYENFGVTGPDGRYIIGSPYPTASFVGWGGKQVKRNVQAGRTDVDFVADPPAPAPPAPATQPAATHPSSMPASQPAEAAVLFRVVGEDGQPVKGARVWVIEDYPSFPLCRTDGASWSQTLQTDERGQVTSRPMPHKPMNVAAWAPGHAPLFVRGAAPYEQAVYPIVLRAGQTVAGQVKNDRGQDLAGITMKVRSRDPVLQFLPDFGSAAVTGADGRFELKHVADGPYTLTGEVSPQAGGWSVLPMSLEVTAGPPPEALAITAGPGVVIRGRLIGPPGAKVAGHRLSVAVRLPRNTFWEVKADEDGRFEIAGIPAGATGMVSVDPWQEYWPAMRWPNVPAGFSLAPTRVDFADPPAGVHDGLEVNVLAMAHVRGTVKDEAGRPVAGCYVLVDAARRMFKTDAQGRYEGEAPPRETVRLKVSGEGLAEEAMTESFVLEPGQELQKDIVSRRPALRPRDHAITGRVINSDGKPVAGASVTLGNSGVLPLELKDWEDDKHSWTGGTLSPAFTKTGPDGRFTFDNLCAGRTDVWTQVNQDWAWQRDVDTNAKDLVLTLAPQGQALRFGGQVVDERGRAVAAVKVFLFSGRGNDSVTVAQTQTDGDGRFLLQAQPPWHHFLHLQLACLPVSGPVAWKILPRVSAEDLKIQLKAEADLSGRILNARGQPVPGARVWLYLGQDETYGTMFFYRGTQLAAPQARTDAQGRYVLGGLPAGSRVSVYVEADGYGGGSAWYSAGIQKGRQIPDVVLRDGVTVEGDVRLAASGQPVAGAKVILLSAMETPAGEALSDAKGHYQITGIDPQFLQDFGNIEARHGSGPAEIFGRRPVTNHLFAGDRARGMDVLMGPSLAARKAEWKGRPAASPPSAAMAVVIDDADPAWSDQKAYHDTVTAYDSRGRQRWQGEGLNVGPNVSSHHMIAADPRDNALWVCEPGGRLLRYKADGVLDWAKEGLRPSAVAVDPETSNAWVLTYEKTIYGKDLLVIDPRGNLLKRWPVPGADIAYSRADRCFWVIGQRLVKVNREGKVVAQSPVRFAYMGAAVEVNQADGTVWAQERHHPQVSGSRAVLRRFSPDGQPQKEVEMEATSLAVDEKRKVVWACGWHGDMRRMNLDGELLSSLPLDVLSLALEPETGCLWAAGKDGIFRIDPDGRYILSIEGPRRTEKWVAVVPSVSAPATQPAAARATEP